MRAILREDTVDYLKQFVIPFVGLKSGKHRFDYLIDNQFFDGFEYSLIKAGNLKVVLDFEKQHESMFILEFSIEGTANLVCDRCNEPFDYPVTAHERVIVKLAEEASDDSDELIILPRSESEIDVSGFIYEFISLAVPVIHIHPDDENGQATCDPKALELLRRLSPENNKEQGEAEDPRWEALRNIPRN